MDEERQSTESAEERVQLRIAGVLGPRGADGERRPYTDLTRLQLGPSARGIAIRPYELIRTHDVIRVDIEREQPGKALAFVLGPIHGSGEAAHAHIRMSNPEVSISFGWIFIWGQDPTVHSPSLLVQAPGTIFAVEIVGNGVERVYFVEENGPGKSITVQCDGEATVHTLDQPGTYMEMNCAMDQATGPTAIPASGALREFIDDAKAAAQAAGWSGADDDGSGNVTGS